MNKKDSKRYFRNISNTPFNDPLWFFASANKLKKKHRCNQYKGTIIGDQVIVRP